jgi:hypothetical protein
MEFSGIRDQLSYGQNVEVSVDPAAESAVQQLFQLDDKGNRRAMVNTDVATPASGKNTMQFKIPPKDHNLASRYPPGKYLLVVNGKTKDDKQDKKELQVNLQ